MTNQQQFASVSSSMMMPPVMKDCGMTNTSNCTPPIRCSPRDAVTSKFRVTNTRRMYRPRCSTPASPKSCATSDSFGLSGNSLLIPTSPVGSPRNHGGRQSPEGRGQSERVSGLRHRLTSDLLRSRTLLRDDIDMKIQHQEAKVRQQECHTRWVASQKPKPLTPAVQIFQIKCLVVESERFQSLTGINDLKIAVVLRAVHSMGARCPPNYYQNTEASVVLFSDIDTLMSMPLDQLPECGPMVFARREVLAFPLWQPLPPTPEQKQQKQLLELYAQQQAAMP